MKKLNPFVGMPMSFMLYALDRIIETIVEQSKEGKALSSDEMRRLLITTLKLNLVAIGAMAIGQAKRKRPARRAIKKRKP